MLAHMLKNDAAASAVIGSTPFSAVGVATPAVLTKALAEDCSDYITSVVLMVRALPRGAAVACSCGRSLTHGRACAAPAAAPQA